MSVGFFRPFYEFYGIFGIDAVLKTDFFQFFQLFDPVKINVEDRYFLFINRTVVLVHDRKGRACYDFIYLKVAADAFYEFRLTRSKITEKCDGIAKVQLPGK